MTKKPVSKKAKVKLERLLKRMESRTQQPAGVYARPRTCAIWYCVP